MGSGETAGHYREMVLLTMIARLADGLPLAASMQEDEQVTFFAILPLWSLAVCLLLSLQAPAVKASNLYKCYSVTLAN